GPDVTLRLRAAGGQRGAEGAVVDDPRAIVGAGGGDVRVAGRVHRERAGTRVAERHRVEQRGAVGTELDDRAGAAGPPGDRVDVAARVHTDATALLITRAAEVGRVGHHRIDDQRPGAVIVADLEGDAPAVDGEAALDGRLPS